MSESTVAPVQLASSGVTVSHRATLIVLAVVAIILVFVVNQSLKEHDARLQAETAAAVQQKSIDAAAQRVASIEKQIEDRDKADADQQRQTADLIRNVQTLAQMKQALPQVITLPSVPTAVSTQQAAAINAQALPNAPQVHAGDVLLPAADAKPLFDRLAQCKADDGSLEACKAARVDLDAQIAQHKVTETALENQRDDYKKALKGGTLWHRTFVAAKWVAIGAGTGYVIGKVAK